MVTKGIDRFSTTQTPEAGYQMPEAGYRIRKIFLIF
jgi:hypothetical protein